MKDKHACNAVLGYTVIRIFVGLCQPEKPHKIWSPVILMRVLKHNCLSARWIITQLWKCGFAIDERVKVRVGVCSSGRTTGQCKEVRAGSSEWWKDSETCMCLMVIGGITYTNNEASDDNIFCMTSTFVKAVLTRRNSTLDHRLAAVVFARSYASEYTHTHTLTQFSFHIFRPNVI